MTPKKRSPKHERVATILGRCVVSIVEDWLARAKQSVELHHLMLSDDERTGHLPKLVKDLIVRLGKRGARREGQRCRLLSHRDSPRQNAL
jgi:chemotaxis receptor (MCP) glutamine deamidase CheD